MPQIEVAWAEVEPGRTRRAQAWRLLAEMLPPDAALSNPCPWCGGPHGRVRVSHAAFVASVTYAAGYAIVAVAATADAVALGIDAEPALDRRREAAGMSGVLGEDVASARDWVRVEAALKADGRGLRIDPATVRVAPAEGGWTAAVPGGMVFRGRDVAGPPGIMVSVATLAPSWPAA